MVNQRFPFVNADFLFVYGHEYYIGRLPDVPFSQPISSPL